MKKLIIIAFFLAITLNCIADYENPVSDNLILQADEIGSVIRFETDDSLAVLDSLSQERNMEICKARGHYAVEYNISKENVLPMTLDFPNYTVMYYYKDNIQRGVILRCKRCGEWLSIQTDKPMKKVLWKKEQGE